MLTSPTENRAKLILAIVITAALCGGLALYFAVREKNEEQIPTDPTIETNQESDTDKIDTTVSKGPELLTVGTSVEGREIEAYTHGATKKSARSNLLFIGGIHGGYEWNTVLLAYRFIDYLNASPQAIPLNTRITIIPSANPDGLYKVVGKEGRFVSTDIPAGTDESIGRFNANGIDLNRNFACKWKSESSWRGKIVSAGASAFSEPEALAIKNIVEAQQPDAVVFWHSQGNAVYASECEDGILPETLAVMNTYAAASGYAPVPSFDAYEISGDAEGWLASMGIPAVTVELKTHQTVEWEQNLAGFNALLNYYSKY